MNEQIDQGGPFLCTFAPSCQHWNTMQISNMMRSETVFERVMDERERQRPMIAWIVKTIKARIRMGRIVMIEHPWASDLLREPEVEKLIGFPDPVTGEPFEFIKCDQCMYGQMDQESGKTILSFNSHWREFPAHQGHAGTNL